MSLRFIPGSGRLYRNDRYIAFFSQPNGELTDLITADDADYHDLFRNLGSAVIKSGFKLPPFVVIALLDEPKIFAYGDIKLAGGPGREPIKSNSTFTWVERDLTANEIAIITVDADDDEEFEALGDCYLDSGMVPAANFKWQGSETSGVIVLPGESTNLFFDESETIVSDDVVNLLPDEPVRAYAQTRRISEPAIAATTAAQVAARTSEDNGDGQDSIQVDPEPTPTVTTPAATPSVVGRLELDDGQTIDVTQSVYVGRFPSKFGLPPGYGSVVVAGDHVSRIHWELLIDGDKVSVADLGSTTGTAIMRPGDAEALPLAAGHVVAITGDTVISFGDRTARFRT